MNNIQYYISRENGPQEGPFSTNQVSLFISTARLARTDLIWREGLTNWQACDSLPEIAAFFRQPVVPPLDGLGNSGPLVPAVQAARNAATVDAGFWLRVVAAIIDALVVTIAMMPVGCLFQIGIFMAGPGGLSEMMNPKPFDSSDPFGVMKFTGAQWVIWIASVLVNLIAKWLYFAFMESSSKQATLGKLALGLKVTTIDGSRLTFARATGRYFASILSYIPLCLGYVIAAFTPRKQALHDLIAQTLVVKRS